MPDTGATIEIEGLDELVRKLDDLGKLSTVHAALQAAALYIKGKVAKYPQSTEANQPRGFNTMYSMTSHRPINTWYQRGYGSKWITKSGQVHGRKSSEQLGQKWTTKYDKERFEAVIGNNASYAIFVQGEKQAKFHKARGWITVETVAKEETKRVQEYVIDAVRRAIGV